MQNDARRLVVGIAVERGEIARIRLAAVGRGREGVLRGLAQDRRFGQIVGRCRRLGGKNPELHQGRAEVPRRCGKVQAGRPTGRYDEVIAHLM
jgi:hypothetical protein